MIVVVMMMAMIVSLILFKTVTVSELGYRVLVGQYGGGASSALTPPSPSSYSIHHFLVKRKQELCTHTRTMQTLSLDTSNLIEALSTTGSATLTSELLAPPFVAKLVIVCDFFPWSNRARGEKHDPPA